MIDLYIFFSTGVKRVIGGNMDLTGKKSEGKMVVKYDTTPISTTSTLTILDTDYDTYAVIWSCSGLGPVNARKYSLNPKLINIFLNNYFRECMVNDQRPNPRLHNTPKSLRSIGQIQNQQNVLRED